MSERFLSSSSSPSTSAWPGQNATNGYRPVTALPATTTSHSSSSIWQPPAHWNVPANAAAAAPSIVKKSLKRKHHSEEEEASVSRIASRVSTHLAADQAAVTAPDVDTPFTDAADVVKRLLPYHVFQQPQDDLRSIIKGKHRATEQDELNDTRFALECFKRRAKLMDRFRKIRTKPGTRAAPSDQAFLLEQYVHEAENTDHGLVKHEKKSLQEQQARIEKERRAAENSQRALYYAQQSAAATTQPPPATLTSTMARQPYFQSYPYNYTHATPMASGTSTFSVPLAGTTHSLASSGASTPVPPVAPPPLHLGATTFPFIPGPTAPPHPHSYSTQSYRSPAPTLAPPQPAASSQHPTIVGGAVPVQLPVSALPALQSFGIMPVIAPPPGSHVPVILRGSSDDGTKLHLEFNVALLTQEQRQGLGAILTAMMTNTNAASAQASSVAASSGGSSSGVGQMQTSP